jgi:uncharacterized membrane protein YdjX (TVP38/TMEM64 family)
MKTKTTKTKGGKPQEKNQPWWKWGIIGGVVVGLLVASRVLPVAEWLVEVNEWLDGMGPLGLVVFMGIYVVATILFLPGLILTLGAGAVFGIGWGFLAVSVGSTIGAGCAFLIGRYLARDKVAAVLEGKPKFVAIDRAVGEKGWKIVALLRLSPVVPFNLQNYFYGLTAISFWPYLLASWIGMMPGTLLYVYLGAAGRVALEAAAEGKVEGDPLQTGFFIAGLVATVAVTIYVTKIARKALKEAEPEVEKGDR